MTENIEQSNAAQSDYFAQHAPDVAYPEWSDLTDDEKRQMIADHHPLASAADDSSSGSRQHFIDTGRYLTNAEVFEFERVQEIARRIAEIEEILPGKHWAPVGDTPAIEYRLAVADETLAAEYRALVAEREAIAASPESSGEPGQRDYGDVFEEYAEAWQIQNAAAYVVAISLRVAVKNGLVLPEFLATEMARFEAAERRATEFSEVVRNHPTHKAQAEAVQIEGD